jgi:hypothetical protein
MTWWKTKAAPANAAPPREKLLEVARAAAIARGWPWIEPVAIDVESVSPQGRVWAIRTNCQNRGQNIRIAISEADFAVVSAGFLPR